MDEEGIEAWIKDTTPFHVKLYSLCFAVFGRFFGYTTLSAEPLNLLYYLLVLALVFAVGARGVRPSNCDARSLCGRAVALALASHDTALTRPVIYLYGARARAGLRFVFDETFFVEARLACRLSGRGGGPGIWLIRSQMWEVTLAIVLLTLR